MHIHEWFKTGSARFCLFLKPIGLDTVIEAVVRVEARVLCRIVEGNINQGNKKSKFYSLIPARQNSQNNSLKVLL